MPRTPRAPSPPATPELPAVPTAPPPAPAASPRGAALRRELAGVALLVAAAFAAGALLLERTVPGAGCSASTGPFGPVGGCLRASVLLLVGAVGAVFVPLAPAVHGLRLLGRGAAADRGWLVLLAGLVGLAPVAAGLARGAQPDPSAVDPLAGLWGGVMSHYLVRSVGMGGAWFVVALAGCALAVATLAWNPLRLLLGGAQATSAGGNAAGAGTDGASRGRPAAEALEPDPTELPALDPALVPGPPASAEPKAASAVLVAGASAAPSQRGAARSRQERAASAMVEAVAEEMAADPDGCPGDDELPSPELLTPPPPRDAARHTRDLDANGQRLMDALRTFRVDGQLTGRTQGPTVTQYEIEPAPGVKVRQFATLANDLALAMRAPSIRVVAPIPGKGAVGVEIPNPSPELVAFRELIESAEYRTKPMALPVALGKDLEGRPVVTDLARMPHLLIAGATGSGKSVCVNTIITSLIYRHTPATLRFLLVDPKMVELSVYNVLPHLRHKVVTDHRDAAAVLKWAVLEMQERYQLLAANGARNIQDFNQKVRAGAPLAQPRDPGSSLEPPPYTRGVLPYIVVVIDELADLMMTVQGEVETPLAILAQKARAIGIHLILATQRPSVNVITGLIKANFPSRIAFRVASQVDSRTIIDGIGAEALLGNGDLLFIPPGRSEPSRLQGAFLSSEDTERLMRWYADRAAARRRLLAAQGVAGVPETTEEDILAKVRAQEALEAGQGDEEGEASGERDRLFREAAEVCIQAQGGSTSLLQRRLKIGYGRAARIIDQLQQAGVLGPPDGSKPRDVLIGLDDLARIASDRVTA